MHRIRVGLTGLACVFLLVMLATAFLRMAGVKDFAAPPSNTALTLENAATPNEPLAQLGVAPGNAPEATQPAPTKAAQPTR